MSAGKIEQDMLNYFEALGRPANGPAAFRNRARDKDLD